MIPPVKRKLSLTFLLVMIGSSPAWAGEASSAPLAHGASVLPKGTSAFSLGGGYSFPEPVVYSLRYDRGVLDRLQLGISGGTIGIIGTATIHTKLNLVKTKDEAIWWSFHFDPSFFYYRFLFANFDAYLQNIATSFEYRFGNKKRTGVFANTGVILSFINVRGSSLTLFDNSATNTTLLPIFFRGSGGIQHSLTEHFSIALEAGDTLNLSKSKSQINGLFRLTWTF